MTPLHALCPGPPAWRAPRWSELTAVLPQLGRLAGCPQDPIYHREGDVRCHTQLVCQQLAARRSFRALPEDQRVVLFAAAALHDVAKPDCLARHGEGRVGSAGHARRGALVAREALWRLGLPFALREAAVGLVRHHLLPFFAVDDDRDDGRRRLFGASYVLVCEQLALLAECDVRGRSCDDQQRLLEQVELFVELCREQGCLDRPRAFANDQSRFEYFRTAGRDPGYRAHDRTRCEAVLLSGLPGAGKDHLQRERFAQLPVISLDRLRQELGIGPEAEQGRVVAVARERARELLRRGSSFVWNATNLSRRLRRQSIDLFTRYGARTRVVYVEVGPDRLMRQNRERARRVPADVIARLLRRWEPPDATEAQQVEYWVAGVATGRGLAGGGV